MVNTRLGNILLQLACQSFRNLSFFRCHLLLVLGLVLFLQLDVFLSALVSSCNTLPEICHFIHVFDIVLQLVSVQGFESSHFEGEFAYLLLFHDFSFVVDVFVSWIATVPEFTNDLIGLRLKNFTKVNIIIMLYELQFRLFRRILLRHSYFNYKVKLLLAKFEPHFSRFLLQLQFIEHLFAILTFLRKSKNFSNLR